MQIVPEQWVFCEYEAATKEVLRLDAATLLPITRQWFCLRTYNDLDLNGYEQQTINHKPCRRHRSINRNMALDYLAESRWSQRFGNKYMKNIVV